eukprot:1266557-Pyramimonas_sp.AAC.1
MRKVAEFAEGELSYLALQGKSTGNPGLPLTESQKRQETQKKEQARRAAAAKANADATSGQGDAAAPQAAAGIREKVSTTTSKWAPECRNWKKGSCSRGINCFFKHEGIPTNANRCFICGEEGHSTKECTAPGGGKDPDFDKNWTEYRKRRDEAQQKAAQDKGGKGKTKGKKDGGGKGYNGNKGPGSTSKSCIAAAAGPEADKFPLGAVGLDSWANVHLVHQEPSKETSSWTDSLKLAWGSCPCQTGQGPKG